MIGVVHCTLQGSEILVLVDADDKCVVVVVRHSLLPDISPSDETETLTTEQSLGVTSQLRLISSVHVETLGWSNHLNNDTFSRKAQRV